MGSQGRGRRWALGYLAGLLFEYGELLDGGLNVCLQNDVSKVNGLHHQKASNIRPYLCQLLGLGNLGVGLFGEVPLGLECRVCHGASAMRGLLAGYEVISECARISGQSQRSTGLMGIRGARFVVDLRDCSRCCTSYAWLLLVVSRFQIQSSRPTSVWSACCSQHGCMES